MFKRLYWSGSHARFYGVTWGGYDTQVFSNVTVNYHTNVIHAFQTAAALNPFLNGLTGTNIVMAHSLGNMVALSVLNDFTNNSINKYFMIDAAVSLEAIDVNASGDTNMIPPDWLLYSSNAWCSEWHYLWPTNDGRSQLTWVGRLSNLRGTQVYNFYSSGEEVLRTDPGAPPSLFGVAEQQVVNAIWNKAPVGVFAWALQEKEKGRMSSDLILGSSHGGWGYNGFYGTLSSPPSPSLVATLTSAELQTNPVFNTTVDTQLFQSGTNGSTYARLYENQILSDAIPALGLPIGANPVSHAGIVAGNINMMGIEDGWPANRLGPPEPYYWYHSDVRVVAYAFVHNMFDDVAFYGQLR